MARRRRSPLAADGPPHYPGLALAAPVSVSLEQIILLHYTLSRYLV